MLVAAYEGSQRAGDRARWRSPLATVVWALWVLTQRALLLGLSVSGCACVRACVRVCGYSTSVAPRAAPHSRPRLSGSRGRTCYTRVLAGRGAQRSHGMGERGEPARQRRRAHGDRIDREGDGRRPEPTRRGGAAARTAAPLLAMPTDASDLAAVLAVPLPCPSRPMCCAARPRPHVPALPRPLPLRLRLRLLCVVRPFPIGSPALARMSPALAHMSQARCRCSARSTKRSLNAQGNRWRVLLMVSAATAKQREQWSIGGTAGRGRAWTVGYYEGP